MSKIRGPSLYQINTRTWGARAPWQASVFAVQRKG
jgi:hypothetical protein